MQPSTVPLSASLLGIFSDPVAETVAVFVGLTTLFAGAARYEAVLAKRSERRIEHATGVGFFFGMAFATALFLIDTLT